MNPLADLPLNTAEVVVSLRYASCATLCAWLWNLFVGFSDDVKLVSEFGLTWSNLCYILSRIIAAIHVTLQFLIIAAPIRNCNGFSRIITGIAVTTEELSVLLFFVRIKAVFSHSPFIVHGFLVVWMAQAAGAYTANLINTHPFAVHIGSTMYRVPAPQALISCVATILSISYDTVILTAITRQLLQSQAVKTPSKGFRAFFFPPVFGQISKVILHTGQLYYPIAISANVLMLAGKLNQSWSPTLRLWMMVPATPLLNIVSCAAYRALMLRVIGDPKVVALNTVGEVQTLVFAQQPSFVDRSRTAPFSPGVDLGDDSRWGEEENIYVDAIEFSDGKFSKDTSGI